MNFRIFFVTLPLSSFLFSSALAAGAHEHGAAKLDISFDGTQGLLRFETSAEDIYGFEHEAKSEKDKATRDAKIEILKSKFSEMVVLDPKAGCVLTPGNIEAFVAEKEEKHDEHHGHKENHKSKKKKDAKKHSGTHGEVHAEFKAECKNSVSGTKVNFAFKKHFPGIKKVTVQVVSGETQNGATIKNDKGSVGL